MSSVLPHPVRGRALRTAMAAVLGAAGVTLATLLLDLGVQAALVTAFGGLVLAGGLLAGLGAVVVVGAALQVAAVAVGLAASAADDSVRVVAVPLAVLLWATAELAWSSLAHRPDAVAAAGVRLARGIDVVVVALAGAVLAGVALVASAASPTVPLDVRVVALAAVVGVVGVVALLSRRRRARR